MAERFSDILNMSLTASIIILCVLAARLLLKKAPKVYAYALWSVVLFRLLCPVSLSASVSALKVADITLQSVAETQVDQTRGPATTVTYFPARQSAAAVPVAPGSEQKAAGVETDTRLPTWISWGWMAGVAALLAYSALVYLRLHRKLICAVQLKGNIYLADHIPSAFVSGILHPRIYLPSETPMEERRYIIAHERHHIHRGDHIWKLLAYLALCLHWFNPLVWLAFFLAGKDMEMSCDEAVIRKLGDHIRADYAQTLLRHATHKYMVGTPLAFGTGDTGSRVRNLARWKKPAVWVSLLCFLVCGTVLLCCAVNPEQEDPFAGGPGDVGLGALNLTLPENFSANRFAPGKLELLQGWERVGGIWRYDAPEFALLPDGSEEEAWNGEAWVRALGIPEEEKDVRHRYSILYHNEPEGSNGYKLYGDLVAAYWPVETDQPGTVHYFYIDDEDVYDLWFDETKIDRPEIEQIMDTARLYGTAQREGITLGEGVLHRNNFHVRCPGGFYYRTMEDGNIALSDGYQDIGGIRVYSMPDHQTLEVPVPVKQLEDHFYELQTLGIPEAMDESMQHGATADSYGDLEARFWTEEETAESGTAHYLYYDYAGGEVFELWFDLGKMDIMDTWLFLDTAYTMAPGGTLSLEEFTVTLPEGVDWKAQGNNGYLFTVAGREYGGIGRYPLLEPWSEDMEGFTWFQINRLPTRYEEGMWRSAGNSSYADLYFRCGTEGEEGLDYRHEIYITDENIYILWFDWNLVRDNEYRSIMQNIVLDWKKPETETAAAVSTVEESLEKCRAVLDAVQTGSCHISVLREADHDYTQEYLRHEEDLLSVVTVVIGDTTDRHANLLVDGKRYSNMGNWSSKELIWEEFPGDTGVLTPWLDSFAWEDQQVAHVSTQPENVGEAVTLLIPQPHTIEGEGSSHPSYFAVFHFDEIGNFVNVVIQADMKNDAGQDYGITRTESLVSLNAPSIAERIETEYRKAMRK